MFLLKEPVAFSLGDEVEPEIAQRCPKVARLHELAGLGLPVPPGLVLEAPTLTGDEDGRIGRLLADASVIVRSAHPEEDGEVTSWAGLGRSIADCEDLAAVGRAVDDIRDYVQSTWLDTADADTTRPQVLIQRQIRRAWLLVAVWTPEGEWYVEAHDEPGEVLSTGASPRFAGPLAMWDHSARDEVRDVCERARAAVAGRHGLDLELVIEPGDRVWLVQARPLTAPLHPGWPAFEAALAEHPPTQPVDGLLTLDGEHNPAPLSPAHEWLMGWLTEQREGAGHPVVLAGWLYVRVMVRALRGSGEGEDVRTVLRRLHAEHLPGFRARLRSLDESLADCDGASLPGALDGALEIFLAMIDCYLGELVPARQRAAQHGRRHDASQPLSLRERGAFVDVLPAAWDVASPTLAELIPDSARAPDEPSALPEDEAAAATLLAEWDDHLFALGLAPLRAVYLRASELFGLDPAHVFLLTPDDLRALCAGQPLSELRTVIAERSRQARRFGRLSPPLRLWDGKPLPAAGGARLRGVPTGAPFTGRIAQRADLSALIDEPPAPDAIVCIPALTAQAAVAVERLGLRAVCTEYGGALSHGTLMARELGLSALIGCHGCTEIQSGQRARLDTRAGRLVVLG